MQNAHDIMKTKKSEDSIILQTKTTRLEEKTGRERNKISAGLSSDGDVYCGFNVFLVLRCVSKLSAVIRYDYFNSQRKDSSGK